MAQKVQVILVDDVDGGEAAETVSFALDGVSYEIDVSEENAEALREALAPWVGHARRVGGRSGGGRARSTSSGGGSSRSRGSSSGGGRQQARPFRRAVVGAGERLPGQRPGPGLLRGHHGLREGALTAL